MDKSGLRQQHAIESWNRFVTRGLAVSPELMGFCHKFMYEDKEVEISLPDISKVGDRYGHSTMATIGSRRTVNNEPLEYEIFQVEVRVNMGQSLLIDPETFNRNPVAYELYSENEQEEFEKFCNSHEQFAKRSFEYWLSVLRCVLDDYRIGRLEIIGNETGWSTYLEDCEEHRTVWIQRQVISIEGYRVIKPNEWDDIQNYIERNQIPPTYISLKHDAEESMSQGDYVRSVIEFAMACEIFIRFMVLERLPGDLKNNLIEAIEELNINQYVTKHFRALIPKENLKDYGRLSSELSSLFSKRNKILHMGKNEGATKENCARFLTATNKLVTYRKVIENT